MTDQAAIVAEGRAALARIKDHSRRLFEDYVAIGAALLIGRSECLKLAGSNSLQTPAYRTHWRRWLDQHGFGDMEAGERIKTMWLAENKAESEQREVDFHLLSFSLFTWHLTWSIL